MRSGKFYVSVYEEGAGLFPGDTVTELEDRNEDIDFYEYEDDIHPNRIASGGGGSSIELRTRSPSTCLKASA